MKTANFYGLVVGVAGLVIGFSSLLIAGGGPSAPTLEGGPTYVSGSGPAASLQGTPLPAPQTSTGSLFSSGANQSGGGGLQTGAPGTGSNYFGSNTGASERGVAGSGLPREKVAVVDTKALSSTKTDGTFSSSLMEAGLKSAPDVKSTNSTQKESTKSQTSANKSTSSAKAPEKSASSGDSTKAADKR